LAAKKLGVNSAFRSIQENRLGEEGLKWVSMDLRKHPQHKIAW
jgi:hypothetical protein